MRMGFTCEELEGLRPFRRLSQVAVRQRVAFLPGAAGEWGQRQVLHKQLLGRHKSLIYRSCGALSETTVASSELIFVSTAVNCRWTKQRIFSGLKVSYCRLGGEKKGVLVDTGHVGWALHDQPHSGDRQRDGLFTGRRLVVFVRTVLRHLHWRRGGGTSRSELVLVLNCDVSVVFFYS